MPSKPTTRQQLITENEELRARLNSAEETLRAIRHGEVDALVLSRAEGDRILSLEGALEPYRVMVEAMGEAAVTLAEDGIVLYCNGCFSGQVQLPLEQIIGQPLQGLIAEQDRKRFEAMLVQGAEGEIRETLMLKVADGSLIPSLFSMAPLPQSEGRVISTLIADLSDVVAAAEARSRLALIVDSSDDAMVSIAMNGVVESWNRAAEDLFGYTAGEALGHTLESLIVPPDRLDEMGHQLEAIRAGEFTKLIDTVRMRKGNTQVDVSVKASPILDEAGDVVGASIHSRDITEHKLAENALRESERRFSDLLGNVELVSMMLDREARITYCNEYLLHLTGWQRREVMGKNWWDVFVPPDYQHLGNTLFPSLLDNQPVAFHHENEIVTRSGERRLIRWNNSVLRSPLGEVIGTASIGEDITDRMLAEKDLRWRTAFFEALVKTSAEGVLVVDNQGRKILQNQELNNLFAIPEDIAANPDDSQQLQFVAGQVLDAGNFSDRIEYLYGHPEEKSQDEVRLKSGAVLMRYSAPVLDNDGLYYGRIWSFHDITERKNAEARIQYLNRVLFLLSSINALIVRVTSRDELFRGACDIAVDAGGFRMAMLVVLDPVTKLPATILTAGKDAYLLSDVKNVMSTSEGLQSSMIGQSIRDKSAVVANDAQNDSRLLFGRKYAEAGVKSLAIFPLTISNEVVGTLALYASENNFFLEDEMKLLSELSGDISNAINHLNKLEQLDYLVYYDLVTGLANRGLFLERLTQYIRIADRRGDRLAIGLMDLERFKNINDSLGHSAGDILLKQVADWLIVSTGDAGLLARIDSDHFAFMVPEVSSDGSLISRLEEIAETLPAHSFSVNDTELRLAAKIGFAVYPDDGNSANTLFRNAEAALKLAKASGTRFLSYKTDMNEAVAEQLAIENQLRQAIDNEEFVLYYQPKINMLSGKVTSAEALIRWNDPRTGLVPPGKFIPILEETGMIYQVGRWALKKVAEDNKRWREAGLATVRIAVNVSPLQLRNSSFIDEIRRIVDSDTQAAAGLELEITESVIMNDIQFNIATLQAIRALGLTIAIDDFGTGFSSLSYLAKLPVDTLKIDRAFIIEMTAGPEGLSLVSTIINLAHALKHKVVAEGVETEEQFRLLHLLGCDEMQGFLISKPVPAEIFEEKFLKLIAAA